MFKKDAGYMIRVTEILNCGRTFRKRTRRYGLLSLHGTQDQVTIHSKFRTKCQLLAEFRLPTYYFLTSQEKRKETSIEATISDSDCFFVVMNILFTSIFWVLDHRMKQSSTYAIYEDTGPELKLSGNRPDREKRRIGPEVL